jgi:hypothetical protein
MMASDMDLKREAQELGSTVERRESGIDHTEDSKQCTSDDAGLPTPEAEKKAKGAKRTKKANEKTCKKHKKSKGKKPKKKVVVSSSDSASSGDSSSEDNAQKASSSDDSSSDSDSDKDTSSKKRPQKRKPDSHSTKKKTVAQKKSKKQVKFRDVSDSESSDSSSDADNDSESDDDQEASSQRTQQDLQDVQQQLQQVQRQVTSLTLGGGAYNPGGLNAPAFNAGQFGAGGLGNIAFGNGAFGAGGLGAPGLNTGLHHGFAPPPMPSMRHGPGRGGARAVRGGGRPLRLGGRQQLGGGLANEDFLDDLDSRGASKSKSKSSRGRKGGPHRLEFKRVDQVWDNQIHSYKLEETTEDTGSSAYDGYLFHVRRTFDWEGKYKATIVDIKSKPLREALQEVMGNIKGVSLVEDTPKLDPNMLFL